MDKNLERETGFEPATSTLARSHSTTELLPLNLTILQHDPIGCQFYWSGAGFKGPAP